MLDPLSVPGARPIEGFEAHDPEELFPTPFGDHPPAEWFLEPHPEVVPGASGIITSDGRFCAYSHEWDRCHNGYTDQGECWTPPRSVTGNRYFMQSSIVTAEGIQMPCGVIPLGDGHADPDLDVYAAMQHYDRPERVRVRARAIETDHGCIMCGAIVPGTTYGQVAIMRAAALSGDWRYVPELNAQDFLGPCFVTRPGLPLGLEAAALDQAFWDIAREVLQSDEAFVTADGTVVPLTVRTMPVAWSPRPTLTERLPAAMIAAAMNGEPMTQTIAPTQVLLNIPAGMSPESVRQVVANAAAPTCTCGRRAAAEGGPVALDPILEPVAAHPEDTAAIATLQATVDTLVTTVEQLAVDVSALQAQALEPADVEMPTEAEQS